MNVKDFNEYDKSFVKEIIYFEDQGWTFIVKTKDDKQKRFVISHNRGGQKWVELWGDYDAYKSLESAITQDPMAEIIENDTSLQFIKYTRQGCEFSLLYIEYVDFMIDLYWDGKPFIKFSFVEIGHPDFEAYVNELLRLLDLMKKTK